MSKRPRINSNPYYYIFLIAVFIVGGCFESEEGCLDSNANNFDVHADENCCCTYPNITVGVNQKVAEKDFSTDSIYTNDQGERYRILESSFYISGFRFKLKDGRETTILDTLHLEIPIGSGTTIELEDNYSLVTSSSSAFVPGTIDLSGQVEQIQFNIGLDVTANMTIPEQFENTHALGSENALNHYSESTSYIFNRMKILPIDLPSGDTLSISISGDENLLSIILNTEITIVPGQNTVLGIDIDYGAWVEGINFAAELEMIQSEILQNTNSVFSVTP